MNDNVFVHRWGMRSGVNALCAFGVVEVSTRIVLRADLFVGPFTQAGRFAVEFTTSFKLRRDATHARASRL